MFKEALGGVGAWSCCLVSRFLGSTMI